MTLDVLDSKASSINSLFLMYWFMIKLLSLMTH